jgi:hypothetical protein
MAVVMDGADGEDWEEAVLIQAANGGMRGVKPIDDGIRGIRPNQGSASQRFGGSNQRFN